MLKNFQKGQSSIEFLAIVGIALIILSPFILSAQDAVLNVRESTGIVELRHSMDKIASAVRTVSTAGEPAEISFIVNIPESASNAMIIREKIFVYTVSTRSGKTNISKTFDTNITATNGLPVNRTRAKLEVEAWNNQVNITVIK